VDCSFCKGAKLDCNTIDDLRFGRTNLGHYGLWGNYGMGGRVYSRLKGCRGVYLQRYINADLVTTATVAREYCDGSKASPRFKKCCKWEGVSCRPKTPADVATTTTTPPPSPPATTTLEWIEFDNFCVSQFNEDLLGSPMPAGNANIKNCKSICNGYNSTNYCSAIEWYNNGWNGVKCFLILDDIPASQGFDGTRWRDATCHVKADPLPNVPGCWIRYPSGCPNQKSRAKYNVLQNKLTWNNDNYNGASDNSEKCQDRQQQINDWCGVDDIIVQYVKNI